MHALALELEKHLRLYQYDTNVSDHAADAFRMFSDASTATTCDLLVPRNTICQQRMYVSDCSTHSALSLTHICVDGSATCLEDGCLGAEIPLVARVEAPNGGRDIGLGSLSAYRVCI